ncbi:MAG: metallophosphoesterase [Candidatus Methylomirabilales bacterium]
MLIGLMSDSHDHLERIERAVERMNSEKVDSVIHAGDFIAPFALDPLDLLKVDWVGIYGNNDGEKVGLNTRSAGRITKGPLRLTLDNRRITVVHILGDLDLKAEQEQADVVVFGHSHRAETRSEGSLLLVNPGEVYGWRTGRATVATLDTKTLTVRFYTLWSKSA